MLKRVINVEESCWLLKKVVSFLRELLDGEENCLTAKESCLFLSCWLLKRVAGC